MIITTWKLSLIIGICGSSNYRKYFLLPRWKYIGIRLRKKFPDTFINHLEIEDDILKLVEENERLKTALLAANADANALAEELRGEQNPGFTCYELRMHDNRVRIKSTEDSDGS